MQAREARNMDDDEDEQQRAGSDDGDESEDGTHIYQRDIYLQKSHTYLQKSPKTP